MSTESSTQSPSRNHFLEMPTKTDGVKFVFVMLDNKVEEKEDKREH